MAATPRLRSYRAVLFDCDGVLVDSEPHSERAWQLALSDFGLDVGDFTRWVGKTDIELADHFAREAGVGAGLLSERAKHYLMELLAAEPLVPWPDALAVADRAVELGVRLAVVTNSERWRLEAILASGRLADRFRVAVTSDDVELPKPAPHVYLRAATLLELAPEDCLVLEDSPVGVRAAVAAGMTTVAIDRGMFGVDELAAAHLVAEDATVVLDAGEGARF